MGVSEWRMTGRRIPDDEFFERAGGGELQPGDYGKVTTDEGVDWFVVSPAGGAPQALAFLHPDASGNRHTVTEHDDKTITVRASILSHTGWHGWLTEGVWHGDTPEAPHE